MKVGIDSQAKSEVGELLQDYVVSPLNADMIDALQKTKDTFSRETAESAENITKKITVQIGRLQTGLTGKFQTIRNYLETDLPDAVADSQKEVCDQLSDLAGTIQSALTANEDLERSVTAAAQSANQSLSELKTQLTVLSQLTQSDLAHLSQVTETEFTALKHTSKDDRTAVIRSLDNISSTLEQEYTALLSRMDALELTLSNVRENAQAELVKLLAESRAEMEQHWYNLAAHQAESKSELEQYYILSEKRYKTLFVASSAVGITTFLAVCALLLIHFL